MRDVTNCDTNSGNMQHYSGNFVESGTINQPLRLRNERCKNTLFIKHTWQNIQQNGIKRISEETM